MSAKTPMLVRIPIRNADEDDTIDGSAYSKLQFATLSILDSKSMKKPFTLPTSTAASKFTVIETRMMEMTLLLDHLVTSSLSCVLIFLSV